MDQNNENTNWIEQLVTMGRKHFWEEQKLSIAVWSAGIAWVLISLIVWVYFLTAGTYGKVLTVELISNGIVFLLSLFWICKVGYEDRIWRNIWCTFLITVIITMAAMYIADVQLLRPAQTAEGVAMNYIIHFLMYLLIDVIMAAIPVLLNCAVMYVIMRIFGEPIQ